MTTARDCITRKVGTGRIPADRGRRLLAQLAEFERTYENLGPVAGAHKAAEEMAAVIAFEAKRKRELTQRQVMALDRMAKEMANDPKGAVHAAVATMLRVDKHREAVRGQLHGMVTKGLQRFRSKALGFKRDRAGEANVVRALFGDKTGDTSADEIAQAYGDAFEYGRVRKNAAGANVAARKDWRLPNPSHDMRRIFEAGRDAWKRAVLPLLDDATFEGQGERRMEVATEREKAFDHREQLKAEGKAKRSEVAGYNARIKGIEARIAAAEVRLSGNEGRRAALLKEYEAQLARLVKHHEGADQAARVARADNPFDGAKAVTLSDVKGVVESDALGQDELIGYLQEAIADLRGAASLSRPGQLRAKAKENQTAIGRLRDQTERLADRTAGGGDALARLKEERARLVDRRATAMMERDQIGKKVAQWQKTLSVLDEQLSRLRDAAASKDEFLDHVYETLSTDGLNKMKPGQGGGRGRLASRDDDAHRVLVFKDADAWLRYNDQFGNGDVFQSLNNHLEGLAHDIAFLEVMGPNPEATKRFITDTIAKTSAEEASAGDLSWKGLNSRMRGAKHFENVYDDVAGLTSTPVDARLARGASMVRSVLVSAQLGSAFLSSFTDAVTMAMTARFNGLPATRVLAKSLQLMVSEQDRAAAVQLGLVADGWAKIAGASVRYAGEVFDDGWAGRLADFTMRASLLKPATEARQWAFGMEFLGALGRMADQEWGALPPRLRKAMERYGMGATEWGIARQGVVEIDGARFLQPQAIARGSDVRATDVATTLHRMVLEERDYAVIVSDPRARAWMQQGTRTGTVSGELLRFLGMYKAFPITVLTRHVGRALEMSWGSRVGYLSAFFVGSTLMGMAAWQAKQVVRGKDAVTMDPTNEEGRAAWGAAMLQGGGAGIFGDFLFADQNRFGGGLTTTLAGPAAGLASDLAKATAGNVQQLVRGEDPEILAEAIAFGGRYTPGSSIWYARLALERAVLDQLTLFADPDAPRRFARMERNMRKDYGQSFWWRPGKAAPDRAPKISTLVE